MTFVIAIAQRKGGAGKTTVACQLASVFLADGLSVLGVDLDEQKSFAMWAALRRARLGEEPAFSCEVAPSYALSSALRRRAADIAIIDTAPAIDACVERAIRAADLVVTPIQLSPIDLAACLPTAKAVGLAGRPSLFVINRAPPRARVADEIREQIARHRLPVAKTEFGNRAAFTESMGVGAGVTETAPSSVAAIEARALAAEVLARSGAALRAA